VVLRIFIITAIDRASAETFHFLFEIRAMTSSHADIVAIDLKGIEITPFFIAVEKMYLSMFNQSI
jgi:hypothetical protein